MPQWYLDKLFYRNVILNCGVSFTDGSELSIVENSYGIKAETFSYFTF